MYLIIGYGNSLRCDDGLGLYLAEKLGGYWEVITSIQLMPEFAEPISRAKRIVFIDTRIGNTPGEVISEAVESRLAVGAFTHHVTPASLLAAAQALYGTAPQAILITITGASFEYGCDFSPQIRTQLVQIISRVEAIIAAFFQ